MSPESEAPASGTRARVPRIVVTGGESTGKTTLAAALANALGSHWVPEYSRTYAEQVGRALTSADVEPIARGQVAVEDAAIERWRAQFGRRRDAPPLVLDTDLVSTTVYAEHYYGECPEWIMAAARARLGDLYLLCEPDLPWEADGVRDQPEARQELHSAFSRRLRDLGARVESVTGVGEERLRGAMAVVARRR
ncbi:MAG: AAA family ATPase [Gemmatimonadota bacterium]